MIISLTGPSGIGKGFLKEKLLEIYPSVEEIAWFTTRPERPNEKNRNCVSKLDFETLVNSSELTLIQRDLYGYNYGVKMIDLLDSRNKKLIELHPNNLKRALEINPSIICIGLITNDFNLLRYRLLEMRKTENNEEIDGRIKAAKVEVEIILQNKELFKQIIEVNKITDKSVEKKFFEIIKECFKK